MNTYLDFCWNIILFSIVTFVTLAIPAALGYLVAAGYGFWKDGR